MTQILLNVSPYLFIASTFPILIVGKYLLTHYHDADGDIKKLRNLLLVIFTANLLLMVVEILIIFAVIYDLHLFKNDRLIALSIALSVLATTNWYALYKTKALRSQ